MECTEKQFPYHSIVHLNQNSIQELIWWVNNLEISNVKSILSPINKTIIQTDASQKGWGAHCQKMSIGGQWTLQEPRLHISLLELKAINLSLLTFHKMFSMKAAHFQVGNTKALSYLMKMGGTRSRGMTALTKEIWEFVLSQKIIITAEYLPGIAQEFLGFQ